MAYLVHQINKKSGVTYVYEASSFWDKKKKQPRNKQVCIGKIDSLTGKFIPSKRLSPVQAAVRDPEVVASAKIVGPFLILDKITKQLGLDKLLKSCFPDTHYQILTMVYYLMVRGGPLAHCEAWCKGYKNPLEKPLTSQRIRACP